MLAYFSKIHISFYIKKAISDLPAQRDECHTGFVLFCLKSRHSRKRQIAADMLETSVTCNISYSRNISK